LRVLSARVLKRIFGPRKVEAKGGLRKLHSEEFHNLYPSPNIIRVIKSRKVRWAGYVACMGGDEEYIYNFCWKA
jgi:hypothetical protein